MNHDTQKALSALTADSTELVIRDDKNLSYRDIRTITKVIANHPMLDTVTVSDCNLGYFKIKRLASAIGQHPSVTKVDLSKNRISDDTLQYSIIGRLAKSPRLHSVDTSQQFRGSINWTYPLIGAAVGLSGFLGLEMHAFGSIMTNFGADVIMATISGMGATLGFVAHTSREPDLRKTALRYPTLTKIKSKLYGYTDDLQNNDGHYKNILNISTPNAGDNNLSANQAAAQVLLDKISNNTNFSFDDVQQINRRLPAVLYLAEKVNTRTSIVKTLVQANVELPPEYGIIFDIDRFITRNDARIIGIELPTPTKRGLLPFLRSKDVAPHVNLTSQGMPVVTTSRIPSELPTVRDAVASLPLLPDKDTLRRQLEVARNNSQELLGYGRDAIAAISNIAMASLQASTSITPLERPVRSMAAFLDEFTQAKDIVANYAQQGKKTLPKRLLSTVFGLGTAAENLRNLADAGIKARRSGIILQGILPVLDAMDGDLAQQLTTTHQIVDAYRLVGQHVCNLRNAGEDVVKSWEKEASQDLTLTTPRKAIMADNKPFHVTALGSRLDLLREIDTQIQGHIALHTMQAAIDQKQQGGVTMLRSGNIPLLAERVATFQKQVGALQRASLINGVADATKAATNRANETTMLAAMETVRSIEKLVDTTQQALLDMGQSAHAVARASVAVNENVALRPKAKSGPLVTLES